MIDCLIVFNVPSHLHTSLFAWTQATCLSVCLSVCLSACRSACLLLCPLAYLLAQTPNTCLLISDTSPILLVAGGYWRARREMTALIRVYDSSSVTASLLTLLASAGFADLSLALAQNDAAFQLSFLEQAAAKAAAGQWGDAVGQVVADHKRSLGYPK